MNRISVQSNIPLLPNMKYCCILEEDYESLKSSHKKSVEENEKMKYDLAIVYEHTNLADSNNKKTFVETNRMIRRRTKKYESLQRTAGPIYGGEAAEQSLKEAE